MVTVTPTYRTLTVDRGYCAGPAHADGSGDGRVARGVQAVTDACPLNPVLATALDNVPVRGAERRPERSMSGLPLVSETAAVMTDDPPAAGSRRRRRAHGSDDRPQQPPTFSFKLGFAVSAGLAPPDSSTNFRLSGLTVANELGRCNAIDRSRLGGLTSPRVVVNDTVVPF